MFEVLYLFVLAWTALPLARTLTQGGGGNHIAFVHRLYRDAAYILVVGLGIIVFEAALGISLENYWFEELGQSHRYWLSLEYRVEIFLVVLLSVGLFIGVNLRALCRPYAVIPASAPWITGFMLAALVGFFATPLWIPLMRFLGATATGVVDPVFGRDLSLYLLALPLYVVVVDIVIGVLCVAIALWVGIGLAARSGAAAFVNPLAPGRTSDRYGSVVLLSPGPRQADSANWYSFFFFGERGERSPHQVLPIAPLGQAYPVPERNRDYPSHQPGISPAVPYVCARTLTPGSSESWWPMDSEVKRKRNCNASNAGPRTPGSARV